ncbi:MAG: hypothetical protein V3S44_01575 [Alphaproteobacteria bacterium]
MKYPGRFAAVITAAVLLLALSGAARAEEPNSVVNHGWEITWNDVSATARHVESGRQVELYLDEKGATEEDGYVNYEMLSVVGPVISYSTNWYSEGGAHPSYGTNYTTVDISKLDTAGDKDNPVRMRAANLAELFGERAVFNQLAANPSVRAAIRGDFSEIGGAEAAAPKSLDELLKAADGG